jgi:hypothetical protein
MRRQTTIGKPRGQSRPGRRRGTAGPPGRGDGRALLHTLANAIGAARLHLLALRGVRMNAERLEALTAAERALEVAAAALGPLAASLDPARASARAVKTTVGPCRGRPPRPGA